MFDNFPLWPARASTTAGNVDALYIFLVVLSAFMSVAIFVIILAFAARYRRRPGHAAEQIEGSPILDITWSVIPFGQVVVMDPSQYDAWLSGGGATGSLASAGESVFQQLSCGSCHRLDAQGSGPNLTVRFGKPLLLVDGRTVIEDENCMRESSLKPSA